MTNFKAAILLSLALAGCSAEEGNSNFFKSASTVAARIERGLTPEQVESILGPPYAKFNGAGGVSFSSLYVDTVLDGGKSRANPEGGWIQVIFTSKQVVDSVFICEPGPQANALWPIKLQK